MSAGWNTIESDAGVFTYLLENLGVKDVQFEELLSLDRSELEALQPIYGVIFLFKYPSGESSRSSSQPQDGSYDHDAATRLFFAHQVIQNACGTQALLGVLLNKDDEVAIGAPLAEFKDFTAGFPAELRGEALSNSALIRETHNAFARASPFADETAREPAGADAVYHFIAYACLHGTLYELDGLQPAPIAHGTTSPDAFAADVIPVLQRRIARYPAGEIGFNLMAMVRDLRIRAREAGDEQALLREERKRAGWMWENALRRHNFVGFVGELLRGVVAAKVGEEGGKGYEGWIEEGVRMTRKRGEERRKQEGEGYEDEL